MLFGTALLALLLLGAPGVAAGHRSANQPLLMHKYHDIAIAINLSIH